MRRGLLVLILFLIPAVRDLAATKYQRAESVHRSMTRRPSKAVKCRQMQTHYQKAQVLTRISLIEPNTGQ